MNLACFLAAWGVCTVAVATDPSVAGRPMWLLVAEAFGMTLAAAIPAFIAQVRLRERRVYHHWTVALALLMAYGEYYANTH